jgi:hypothetical protein
MFRSVWLRIGRLAPLPVARRQRIQSRYWLLVTTVLQPGDNFVTSPFLLYVSMLSDFGPRLP